jgi:hypothetical protein
MHFVAAYIDVVRGISLDGEIGNVPGALLFEKNSANESQHVAPSTKTTPKIPDWQRGP